MIDDLQLAGQVVWSTVHGHMTIELTGYFESAGRDPAPVYAETLRRLGLAYGDDPVALDRSLATVRPRPDRRRRPVSRR